MPLLQNCEMPAGAPLSEDAILELIDSHFDKTHPALILGRGDDCAILGNAENICVSADMFLEDAHFRRSYFYPYELGHKALAINISDLAAFGAKPLAFTLCLGLPDGLNMSWLDSFFRGMGALAAKHRMALAGGDLSRSANLAISIAIFGEAMENCAFLTRKGARPGDALFVVGELGLARAGLAELEANGRDAIPLWPASCRAHLTPEPQTEAGLMLARAGFNARPPALLDLSDGIARDLPRLLNLGVSKAHKAPGARLELDENMLHHELCQHARANGQDAVLEAILGGEDYALLGACAPDLFRSLQSAIPNLRQIGEVTEETGIFLNGHDISGLTGFDHFERKSAC